MRITTVHFDTAHFDALDATYMFSNEKPEVGPSKIVHLVNGEKDGYLDIFKDAERRKYKNILMKKALCCLTTFQKVEQQKKPL
jgi:hypothetical protein